MAILSCHVSIKLPPKISDGQELRPQLLDRVVVRAVWRQGQDGRARTLDRLRHVPREVGLEVVEDHHVPRAEFRDQHLIHIGLERLRVGRPGENQRRPYPIQAQGSDHGRRTPRGGHRALGPLTPPCPGVGRRHRRVDPRAYAPDFSESVPKAYVVVRLRGRLYRNRSRYFAPVSRRSIN